MASVEYASRILSQESAALSRPLVLSRLKEYDDDGDLRPLTAAFSVFAAAAGAVLTAEEGAVAAYSSSASEAAKQVLAAADRIRMECEKHFLFDW